MRTLFTIGFSSSPFMGQDQASVLSKDDQAKFAASLDQAVDKYSDITAWKKNHPNLQADLGSDYDNWMLLAQDDTKYGSAAQALDDKLIAYPDTALSQDDLTVGQAWTQAVNRMYEIMANHTGKPVTPKTTGPVASSAPGSAPTAPGGRQAAPAAGDGSTTPILIGVGAAAVFGLILFATAR